jgi:hypothetical protein
VGTEVEDSLAVVRSSSDGELVRPALMVLENDVFRALE